jgi:hypothetical protein
MASKKGKAAPARDDDIDKLFEGIEDEQAQAQAPSKVAAKAKKGPAPAVQSEQDLLAEFENLGAEQPERPHTPRVSALAEAGKASPSKRAIATPPPDSSARSSEDKPSVRKSGDSARSFHTSFTPSATSSELQESERKAPIAQPAPAAGGGWWGGILKTASAAVKTAGEAVKEIQQNEEAKRWAEQVKGNVGALRGLGKLISH